MSRHTKGAPLMSRLNPLRRSRTLTSAATAAFTAVLLSASLTGAAGHTDKSVPAPPANPTSADQIQNIDQVRTAIKAYYGDTPTTQLDPVDGTKTLHTFSPTGNYVNEMTRLAAAARKFLKKPGGPHSYPTNSKAKAILLDVDDTTLNTYNYEIYSNFAYNPTTNAAFVNGGYFPAVPGMPALVSYAASKHYTIFYLTGRPDTQRAGTIANLDAAGYGTVPSGNLYLKDLTNPIYSACAPTCSTIQYKSLTRKYIESQGYDIVANFGDQYSDLTGGYADKTFKLPNPMYYLP